MTVTEMIDAEKTTVAPRRTERRGRETRRSLLRSVGVWCASVALAAVGWQILSLTSGGWVPSIADVFEAMVTTALSGEFYTAARLTLGRILLIMAIAVPIGAALGVTAGLSARFEAFLRPLLVMGLAVPDPVYIIMSVLILGVGVSSGVIAVAVAIVPLVTNVVLGAVLNRDRGLDHMAVIYNFRLHSYLRHVLAGQVLPALAVSVRTAFAFSWKLVVLMEALVASDGIGQEIFYAFQLLRPAEMVAYAVLFIVVMRVIEAGLFTPVERRIGGWRDTVAGE